MSLLKTKKTKLYPGLFRWMRPCKKVSMSLFTKWASLMPDLAGKLSSAFKAFPCMSIKRTWGGI